MRISLVIVGQLQSKVSDTFCRFVRKSLWQPLGELAQWVPCHIHIICFEENRRHHGE